MECSAYESSRLEDRKTLRDWQVLKPEQREPVLAAFAAGRSVEDISAEFGIDKQRLYGYLRHHNIPYVYAENKRAAIRAQAQQIKDMIDQGWTKTRILEVLNIDHSTFTKRMKLLGLYDRDALRIIRAMNAAKAATNRRLAEMDLAVHLPPWSRKVYDRTNEPASKEVAHNDLEKDHCRYLHGDPRGAHHFCGHQVRSGKVYCDFHYSICYETSEDALEELDDAVATAIGV